MRAPLRNSIRDPRHINLEYRGKQDYQGNHDVYEMPEEQKPSGPALPKFPVKKVCLVAIGVCIVIIIALAFVEMMRQSGAF